MKILVLILIQIVLIQFNLFAYYDGGDVDKTNIAEKEEYKVKMVEYYKEHPEELKGDVVIDFDDSDVNEIVSYVETSSSI